jgi:hypothetical protein
MSTDSYVLHEYFLPLVLASRQIHCLGWEAKVISVSFKYLCSLFHEHKAQWTSIAKFLCPLSILAEVCRARSRLSKAWVCGSSLAGIVGWPSPVTAVCCQVQVPAEGRSLVQRSPTKYVCVCVCVSLSVIRRNNKPLHFEWWAEEYARH